MTNVEKNEAIRSTIWQEEAMPNDPFTSQVCRLRGFDVFGDLLGKISWIEYLYLLFFPEPPSSNQKALLENIAVILANPGPRDHSVRAAMNGAVGGSGNAACLMAALAVGAGGLNGGREIALAMENWQHCGRDLKLWQDRLPLPPEEERADVWPAPEHAPGFSVYGTERSPIVDQALEHLIKTGQHPSLLWLRYHIHQIEAFAGAPLSLNGVIATAFIDLQLKIDQGEMLYLLLRLPGAAAHALEQRLFGWKNYPFWKQGVTLTNDPLANHDSPSAANTATHASAKKQAESELDTESR